MAARPRTFRRAPATTALVAEQAAPADDARPVEASGGSVVNYRNGPGDQSFVPGVDEWRDPIIYDVGHGGLTKGDALRVVNPGPTPPEGHGGYDISGDYGSFIDASTRTQALFESDWDRSTAGKQLSGSFTGAHVVIQRIRPGSDRGYMPSQMLPANQDRNLPGPWDSALVIGGGTDDVVGG